MIAYCYAYPLSGASLCVMTGRARILTMVRVCLLILWLSFVSVGLVARPCETHGWHVNGTFDPCVDRPSKFASACANPGPIQTPPPGKLWIYLPFTLLLIPLALLGNTGLRLPPLLPPPRIFELGQLGLAPQSVGNVTCTSRAA